MQKMEHEPILRVKKLSDRATLPVRGSAGAAGYDLARWEFEFMRSNWKALLLPNLSLHYAVPKMSSFLHVVKVSSRRTSRLQYLMARMLVLHQGQVWQ